MADLVPGDGDALRHGGIGLDGVAGDEPGRRDAVLRQQSQYPLGADDAKFAARDRRRNRRSGRRYVWPWL